MNKKEFNIFLLSTTISAFLIMIVHNFKILSYDKYFIIPMFILIINYMYTMKKNNMIVNKKGFIYLIPIVLILLGTLFIKTDDSNKVLNVIIIPFLISFLFLTLTNKFYNVSRHFIKWFFKLFPTKLFSNLKHISSNVNIKNTNKKKISNILIGILISIPFVIIIMSLLTSADMYFKVFIDNIKDNLNFLLNFKFIKNNLIVFIIYFIIIFSVFINILMNKTTKDEPNKITTVESSIASTLLIIINLVFVLFVVSEISKITVNFLAIPEKYTYAMYAREGFFQLLIVTVINFSIILFFLYKTNIIKENKLIRVLILLLLTFTIILIFNSYYRMFLYINEFGFTILRMQVVLFLLMELILSGIIMKKVLSNLKYRDSNIFATIIITTYVINIYLCNSMVINFINKLINK